MTKPSLLHYKEPDYLSLFLLFTFYYSAVLTTVSFPIWTAFSRPAVMHNCPSTSWHYRPQFKPQALYLMVGNERLWGHEIKRVVREKKHRKPQTHSLKITSHFSFSLFPLKTLSIESYVSNDIRKNQITDLQGNKIILPLCSDELFTELRISQ